ncbi:MAG: substrate-binding domain-containing protein, partial [Desulfovibrionaceae bacterium]
YDDIYLSRYTTPPLTTVHQPKSEIAALAVDALVDRLDSNRTRGGVIRVEPRFVERASVRDLNGPLRARLASPPKD